MNTQYSANRNFNRRFANLLSIFVILAMAFPATGSAYAEDALPPKVGLIATMTGIDDNSFNEMAYQGLLRGANDLGVDLSTYEPQDQSEYDGLMEQCADENELCIVVGFEFRFSLPNIARANPDILWGIIDWSYPDCWEGAEEGVDCGSFTEIPNVRGLRFNEKQAGYLAGVLAGGMTATNVVGAVGGMDVPPVVAFVEGYRNGAQCANPAVNVLTTYTGTFSDPDLGASTAQDMIGQGADVIFGAAGNTGDGAILYSAQNGQWAIGVDTDQYLTVFGNGTVPGSNKLLSSAMKRFDNAVYQTIEDLVNGIFTSGTVVYDLTGNGIGLAPFHEVEVPKRVKKELATVMQGIIDGTININDPCSLPFVGDWRAIDIDGGDIRLAIGGSPTGPFHITWTENYFGFCGGEAGVARGVGWINPEDPYLLEADLHLTCFTTGDQVDFHPVWRFNPATGWLTSRDDDYGGFVTTWHRPGVSLPLMWQHIIAHPDENWVEGMGFPKGTVVSLLIRDSEGNRLFMGTAEAFRPDWDPNNTTAQFFLDFDLKAGYHLWMSDGLVVRELVVTSLQITETSLLTKTVAGIATPGSEVIIEYFPEGADPVMFSVFADQDGFWTAFVEELTFGLPGLASEPDADGDLTRVVFYVPKMDLRVNYGHDWVESFYEGGHTVRIAITESDGVTVKATAELVTEPKDFWGGETGFQTNPEVWVPAQPDIQPYDWVFAQVDNGATAQMQIGDISGMIDLENDSIDGTIMASWITEPVQVECLDWGSGGGPFNRDGGSILTNGVDSYSCSWDPLTEWDIQPGQNVGVGYFGPDGHWAANSFYEKATIIVTSTVDVLANDGVCTLREAVIAANANAPSGEAIGECPAGLDFATDTIFLTARQTYSLTLDSTNEDEAADGDLDVWDNSAATDLILMVEGNGSATILQDASGDDRVLDILGATVDVNGLTLAGGGNVDLGGGVQNTGGTLTMTNSVVSENTANRGGGLFNNESGTLTLIESAVSGNKANIDGGGLWNFGDLTVDASRISANSTIYNGGGLFNYKGTAMIRNGSVVGGDPGIEGNVANLGGGMTIWSGNVTIDASTVFGNSVSWDGGGVRIMNEGTLTVNASVISYNSADHAGGGILNHGGLTLKSSYIQTNFAQFGGGLYNTDTGKTELVSTEISDNRALSNGGGIENHGEFIMGSSSVSWNSTHGSGGGILNFGNFTIQSESQIYRNEADDSGGGIYNTDAGSLTVDSSVIVGNSSGIHGGGIRNDGALTVTATAFLGNTAIEEGDAVHSATDVISATSVTSSCIVGNGNVAVFNERTAPQNFTNNWWGHVSGPGGAGAGSGDSISININFDPWLANPAPCGNSFILEANAGWADSGIDLIEGVPITIVAGGWATTADLDQFPGAISGPDGQQSGCIPNQGALSPCAMEYVSYGALVGRIGDTGEPFLITSSFTFTPTMSGDLYVAVNDNLDYYNDNSGSYTIIFK